MFETPSQFSLHIEKLALEKRISRMDAVLLYCQENFIDPEDIVPLINKSLRDKIEADARENNFLPKQSQLDV